MKKTILLILIAVLCLGVGIVIGDSINSFDKSKPEKIKDEFEKEKIKRDNELSIGTYTIGEIQSDYIPYNDIVYFYVCYNESEVGEQCINIDLNDTDETIIQIIEFDILERKRLANLIDFEKVKDKVEKDEAKL